MTTPTPTAPVVDPTPPTAPVGTVTAPADPKAPAVPAPEPAVTTPAADKDDPETLKAEIARLRKEAADANGKARENARAEAAKAAKEEIIQQLGTALGLVETPTDPEKLAEQVAASTAEAKQAKLELAIYQTAGASNVDAAALLDSRTFMSKAADIDPADTVAMAALIGEVITANPALASRTTGIPAPNPAQGSSAGGAAPTLAVQIATAEQAGDWETARRLKAEQLNSQPLVS